MDFKNKVSRTPEGDLEVQLTMGKKMLMNDSPEAKAILVKYCFCTHDTTKRPRPPKVYAVTYSTGKMVYAHHILMGTSPSGMEVDHINGNGLDNRRANLRFVARRVNAINCKIYTTNKSGVIGMCRGNKCWRVYWSADDGHRRFRAFGDKKWGGEAKAMEVALSALRDGQGSQEIYRIALRLAPESPTKQQPEKNEK
jgi:hypothetical protein